MLFVFAEAKVEDSGTIECIIPAEGAIAQNTLTVTDGNLLLYSYLWSRFSSIFYFYLQSSAATCKSSAATYKVASQLKKEN